jgi:nucleoside-diphosphate-sugar epimerase
MSVYNREFNSLMAVISDCARNDNVLVYFSSAGHIDKDTWYGEYKRRCERAIRNVYCPHLIVRLANVVGSTGNPHQLVPSLLKQVINGEVLVHHPAWRDLIGVDNLVSILIEALPKTISRDCCTLVSGIPWPVYEIVNEICRITNKKPRINLLSKTDVQLFPGDQARLLAPNSWGAMCRGFIKEPQRCLQKYIPDLMLHLGLQNLSQALECRACHPSFTPTG